MRLGEREVSVDEEDLRSLDNAAVEGAIQEGMPDSMASLSARDEDRLRDTIQHYFAWREQLFWPKTDSPRTARLDARRRVADRRDLYEQSIDQIALKLYPDQARAPSKCFQSSLELAYIHYQRATKPWVSGVEEQFLRLQSALLDILEVTIPPLRMEELSVDDFFTDPQSVRPEMYEKHQSFLEEGKDAMDASGFSFLVKDVEASNTDFGSTWRKLKEVTNQYLRFEEGFHTSNGVYPSNDLDNVRLTAVGPSEPSEDDIVWLKLTYYPMGLLELETRSFATLGVEGLSRKWCHGDCEWGEGYPLERDHIRGYTEGLVNLHSASEAHIEKNGCIETSPANWAGTQ